MTISRIPCRHQAPYLIHLPPSDIAYQCYHASQRMHPRYNDKKRVTKGCCFCITIMESQVDVNSAGMLRFEVRSSDALQRICFTNCAIPHSNRIRLAVHAKLNWVAAVELQLVRPGKPPELF